MKLLINKKYTVIVSGGMDSTTLLYMALDATPKINVNVISFNYGQKHVKELEFITALCKEAGIKHDIVDISGLADILKSSLTTKGDKIPHGHYAQENMKLTVVPNRNAIMLAIAYGAAMSNGSDYLLYGAHSGDHFIYPDCRPIFADLLNCTFKIGNEGIGDKVVNIMAPFSEVSKSGIMALGASLKVPYERTWSCYEGSDRPCLECGTCVERTEAFADNNMRDPLLTDEEWNKALQIYKKAKYGIGQI